MTPNKWFSDWFSPYYLLANSHMGGSIDFVHKHHIVDNHHIIALMMDVKTVSKILSSCPELTQLVAQEILPS
jgi:hypothetical protein